jgi:hypothetical protein
MVNSDTFGQLFITLIQNETDDKSQRTNRTKYLICKSIYYTLKLNRY